MSYLKSTPDNTSRSPGKSLQRGISLMESLIALLVLALGIMGLAGVQTRLLTDTRTSNYRAIAVGLIDDLNNRILLNRDAALKVPSDYALTWDAADTVSKDCVANQCLGAEMAQSDLFQWRAAVAAALPGGKGSVFLSTTDARQIGIAVAWTANESKAADPDITKYSSPFAVTAALNGVECPTNAICHIVYVQP
jgi:type IV pilus assembly protein PilV